MNGLQQIKPPAAQLGCSYQRVLQALLFSGISFQGFSATAQEQVITIPNTATANFRDTPGGPVRNTESNPTTLPARVGQAGLEIVKTGDRAAAEPGDTVAYRLLVRNSGSATVRNLEVTDTLPLGLKYVSGSARASLGNTTVNLPEPRINGRNLTFTYPSLDPQQTLTLVYAAILMPDAVRGTGRNLAAAAGRSPGGADIRSNTASHRLEIRPGILSDCGTIVGRVFVDKNFDGEQQPGEPGVPNAVIFMDDGNRVTTDANGLFSLAYVISGYRTGTLDLTSLPGYTIAPNQYRIEANSTSRLVRLPPGGMGRMNFAVTPSFKEGRR
ncbi:DUF11 domain-containing protein [Leptolyngbya sp. FACHB-36]|uniref:DUF7507 domain-containing protein n=1 Tax=Leptolyngbya sp. FACHB-36 TaxID=2692808 RepID=UPI0016812FA4|nr:DUF11 domain-containing protein [Leptolyngbya sp. FACHB-36]MBD2021491.1 DUF11 domain-containing protein [Leptolyngbya sp. FACHB-36]